MEVEVTPQARTASSLAKTTNRAMLSSPQSQPNPLPRPDPRPCLCSTTRRRSEWRRITQRRIARLGTMADFIVTSALDERAGEVEPDNPSR